MKKLISAILAIGIGVVPLVAAQQAGQQTPGAPLPGVLNGAPSRATVTGIVLRSTTGDPIARATVTLTRVAPQQPQGARGAGPQGQRGQAVPPQAQQQAQQQPLVFTTTTDDQGKFQFKDVEEGPYRIVAARNGFTRQEYGQRSFNRPGTVMNIRAGQQVSDISFRLIPASTISGRVMDSNGEPLPGITVQALRTTYDATGKRTLQPASSARTNDLGEYRIYWINPGRYFVSANPARSFLDVIGASASQAAGQAQNQAEAQQVAQAAAMFGPAAGTPNEVADPGFGLTYYPNSPEVSRAVAMDLQPGAEMRAIDFTLVKTQRVQLSGRVIDTTTGRPPQTAAVSVSSRDSSATSPLDAIIGMGGQGNQYNPATGEFVVQNVASGSYWLQVMTQGQAPAQLPAGATPSPAEALAVLNSINSARIPVDVLGADVDNLTLNVSPGTAVPGVLRVEGAQPANQNDLQRIGVSLQSTSGGASILTLLQGGAVRPAADGTFSIPRVTAGDYKLVVTGLAPTFYLKEARFAQTDALNLVTISEPVNGSLQIVVRLNPGQLSGSVVDATLKPVSGIQAVLIPEARTRQDLYKTAVTDQEGRFTFRAITPGDYRVFAWEDIEPFAYFDPSFVMQYEAAGKMVRIQEASAESAEVRIIPASTP